MKIALDVTKLLHEKKITEEEYKRLIKLSSKDTAILAVNILIAFGIVAVVGGVVALDPNLTISSLMAAAVLLMGVLFIIKYQKQWNLLGNILLLIGSLWIAANIIQFFEDPGKLAFLSIFLLFLIIGTVAKSAFMIGLSALALAPVIGMDTGYEHASYMLFVEQPVLTVLTYGLLSGGAYFLFRYSKHPYEKFALVFSGVSLFMVNFGFWVGSLWGDDTLKFFKEDIRINYWDTIFENLDVILAILWAIGLIAVGAWGLKRNKRFVVNTVAVFASIHFYTQWFERLEKNPETVILGGIIAIFLALKLWNYNKKGVFFPTTPEV